MSTTVAHLPIQEQCYPASGRNVSRLKSLTCFFSRERFGGLGNVISACSGFAPTRHQASASELSWSYTRLVGYATFSNRYVSAHYYATLESW
jgi:hypothetical protein